MYLSLGITEEEAIEKELALREREVKTGEYLAWIELAKFAALLAVPVGALFGIGPVARSIKKALTG